MKIYKSIYSLIILVAGLTISQMSWSVGYILPGQIFKVVPRGNGDETPPSIIIRESGSSIGFGERGLYFLPYDSGYLYAPVQLIKVAGTPLNATVDYWIMQLDGNFVGYTRDGAALYHTGTNIPGSYIEFDADGKGKGGLKMLSPAPAVSWQSRTGSAVFFDSKNYLSGILYPGSQLKSGQSISSGNGTYKLIMQTDGNFVLYDVPAGRALWNSGTFGNGNRAELQNDGNLVVYNNANIAMWNSGTSGKASSYLAIQDDGNMVIYTPFFHKWGTTPNTADSTSLGSSIIPPGKTLYSGQGLTSGNSAYSLIMQGDGNLVLYNNGSGAALWDSVTFGAGNYAVMKTDGNFVTYSATNHVLWSSGGAMAVSSFAAVQNNGQFSIYSPNMAVSWKTGKGALDYKERFYYNTELVPTVRPYYKMCNNGTILTSTSACPNTTEYVPGNCNLSNSGGVICK